MQVWTRLTELSGHGCGVSGASLARRAPERSAPAPLIVSQEASPPAYEYPTVEMRILSKYAKLRLLPVDQGQTTFAYRVRVAVPLEATDVACIGPDI